MNLKRQLLNIAANLFIFILFSYAACAQSGISRGSTKDTTDSKEETFFADSVFVYEKPEVLATVDKSAWRKHLEKSLGPLLADAHQSKLAAGTYTIYVRFIIEKDGKISEAKALTDPGYGLARGAEKIIRTGPVWAPAEEKDFKVRSYRTQPITFFKLN